ncbi:MAG: efflux RND transporter periplasmic adaptor subunit [Calditrichia bacterium]
MKQLLTLFAALLLAGLLTGCEVQTSNASEKADDNSAENADSTANENNDSEQNGSDKPSLSRQGFEKNTGSSSAIPVEVTSLVRGDISSSLVYSSTLETEQTVDVYSRIGGLVVAVYVQEGDKVRKGQRLLQIEKDEYELSEQKARLDYEKEKTQFERFKSLQDKELLSEEEFENARLVMKQAEIAWKQAALNLRYTTVPAPISGYAGDRPVRLGDRIQTSTKLLSIANLDDKIVQVYVPQNEFTRTFKGQKAIVTSDVVPGVRLNGFVKRISPIIDSQSGTFKVVVAVKDTKNQLRPGMFVSTKLIVDTHENTRLLPKTALVYENERTFFFVANGETAERVLLDKGFEDAVKVEIMNDLKPGTKVVVLGQSGLKDGSKIKVTNEKSFSWQTAGKTLSAVN